MAKEKLPLEQQRERNREWLKKNGKDPDKLLPKTGSKPTPESENAGAAPSAEIKKEPGTPTATEKEQKEKEERETKAKEAAEEKRILEAKDEELTPEEKTKKKEILVLKQEEKEAKREASTQKRIDHLVGEIKALKAEKNQDKEQIKKLGSELESLQGKIEKPVQAGKAKEQLTKLESERIAKYLEDDKELPRAERREMTREELDDWLVEDLVAAQEWLADRQIRRRDERAEDTQQIKKGEVETEGKKKAEVIVQEQLRHQAEVAKRHPELDISKRVKELTDAGKSKKEIEEIIFKENPKVKVLADILKEPGSAERYAYVGDGPALLEKEMLKRLNGGKSAKVEPDPLETTAEREARLVEEAASEAAEAERQRIANVDAGISGSRNGNGDDAEPDADIKKSPLFAKQLVIWQKQFPKLSKAEVEKRLVKRLKARGETVAS